MRYLTLLPILGALVLHGVDACARYRHCKCHDMETKLPNNWATEQACKKLDESKGGAIYLPQDHHQCAQDLNENGFTISNCDWNGLCQAAVAKTYQWCWSKDGFP